MGANITKIEGKSLGVKKIVLVPKKRAEVRVGPEYYPIMYTGYHELKYVEIKGNNEIKGLMYQIDVFTHYAKIEGELNPYPYQPSYETIGIEKKLDEPKVWEILLGVVYNEDVEKSVQKLEKIRESEIYIDGSNYGQTSIIIMKDGKFKMNYNRWVRYGEMSENEINAELNLIKV